MIADLELSRYKFVDFERQQGTAIGTQQFCLLAIAVNDSDLETVTIGAAGGGLARCRLGELNGSLGIELAGLPGVDLKGAAAIGANVIEAALRLAGVDDVRAVALRTPDEVFYGR